MGVSAQDKPSVEKPPIEQISKNEYQFELGSMWEKESLYWFGLTYGRNFGKCYLINKECSQYFDVTGGVGGREAFSEGLVLAGLRWQLDYLNFGELHKFTPAFKFFGGAINIRDNSRDRQVGTIGAGASLSARLHKNLNLKWESRIGTGDQVWVQTMISISLKLDSFVEGVGESIEKIGSATVNATKVIPNTFKDWFNSVDSNNTKDNGAVTK